ncbi:MAG: DUF11 domain-containing protein [Planctomycetia bacterium]|nr:DUF11 domain-containing protein [Planctomycetia bacterium]
MSDRPSRQSLIVPPPQSNAPIILGSIASACAGFGLVWALGIGRSAADSALQPADATGTVAAWAAAPTLSTDAARAVERPGHAPIGDADHAASPAVDPFPPAAAAPQEEMPQLDEGGGRYPTRRASFDSPETPGYSEPPVRLSRFSEPQRQPLDVVDPGSATIGPSSGSAADPAPVDEPVEPPSEPAGTTAPDADIPEASSPPGSDAAGEMGANEDAAAPTSSAAVPPSAAAAPPSDLPAPDAPPSVAAPPPAALPFDGDDPPTAMHTPTDRTPTGNPLRRTTAATSAEHDVASAVPFATAPAIMPPAAPAPGAPPIPPSAGTATGQGRPGPMQIEGVQNPQVSVEKRGPREVQVGKTARYEIIVRNVGSATAHDVTLRDSVPYGTSLVATSPPASPLPAGSVSGLAGDIVWMLGSLPPGGQARVAMDVLPTIEGDVGSVASVTFRADASARSRATKPDLRIDAVPPGPVLIGREIRLPITITNPGTGVATGVVLEGALPEGVTHASGRELEFDVGQLKPGESRTIDLRLATSFPGVHSARLTARADGRIEVEHAVRLEITAPTLELSAEMPSRRYLQRPATCLISMVNAGTAPAKAVELAAQLPAGMKFVRANNSGYYEERTHRVLWNLEELPAGEIGTVEMVLMPVDLGPQKIVAAARTTDGLSDQVAHAIEVEGLSALVFDVTDSEDPIEVAGTTEFVVRIGNQGTKAASGVRLTATLLGDLEPVEARGPSAHRTDNLTISFEPLARLSPSEEAVFRIRVRGTREGDQRVQVQLTSDDHPSPITKEEITRVYADH